VEHRFQVFVSSTYSDLIEERLKVAQAVIDSDCFPAGMESFPASGDEQFEYIRKVIDQSDYYVLVVGGRYGSRGKNGISFTEMEFNYACEVGLPILVFPHKEPELLPADKRDQDQESLDLLEKFKARALEGRLAKFWTDGDALANQVMRSLLKTTKENPRTGWLRASGAQIEAIERASDAAVKRADELDREVARLTAVLSKPRDDLSSGDDKVNLEFRYSWNDHNFRTKYSEASATVTWNEILRAVGPDLLDWKNEASVSADIAEFLGSKASHKGTGLIKDALRTVRIQLLALSIVEIQRLKTTQDSVADFWRLTEKGRHQMFQLRPIRKSSN